MKKPNRHIRQHQQTVTQSISIDTHTYDGLLKNQLADINTTNKNLEVFEKLKTDISTSKMTQLIPTALIALNLIITSINKPANYDSTNNVKADDILYDIVVNSKYIDIIDDIVIQLSDIVTSGPCPQGRCTRLAQLYFALKN